jgi:hypothetical protein
MMMFPLCKNFYELRVFGVCALTLGGQVIDRGLHTTLLVRNGAAGKTHLDAEYLGRNTLKVLDSPRVFYKKLQSV